MTNNFTAQSDGFDRNLRQLINLSNGTVATIFDRVYAKKETFQYFDPSSIYSWSIGHILEHEFFCFGRLGSEGSKGKKVDLRNSEQLLRVVFSTFGCQQKNFKNIDSL